MIKSEKGFTVIEVGVVLGISAMLLVTGLTLSKPIIEKMQKNKTERQMENINDRLASFVHRNNRLPCPANPASSGEPFGAERGSGGSGAGNCVGADAVGIVPFRALGLDESDVRDGWGNLISYHVSPVFAVNQDDVPDNDHDRIHEFCRSSAWIGNPLGIVASLDIPDSISNWYLNSTANNGAEEITTSDGNIHLTNENGTVFNNESGMYGVGLGGDDINDGDVLTVVFDHPVNNFRIKLADIGNDAGNITFQFWLEEDAGPEDYVEIPIDIDETTYQGSGHGSGWMYYQFNHHYYSNFTDFDIPGFPRTELVEGSTWQLVPNPDVQIYKMRIVTSNGSESPNEGVEAISYHLNSIRDINYADTGNGGGTGQAVNINPAKARFCCPMTHQANYTPASDLTIVDETGAPVVSSIRSIDGTKYDDKDTRVDGSVTSDIFVPAFALISHGKNGHGAYLSNGSGQRLEVSNTMGQGFGADEVRNSDGDNAYVYRLPDHTDDATYFDDVVMWRTQDQIYSEFGNQSCQTP